MLSPFDSGHDSREFVMMKMLKFHACMKIEFAFIGLVYFQVYL